MSAVPALLKPPPIIRQEDYRRYIYMRVVDTLLREDVCQCVSKAQIWHGVSLPVEIAKHAAAHEAWLRIGHLADECIWLPVVNTVFMQRWRAADMLALAQAGSHVRLLDTVEDILAVFNRSVSPREAALYEAFGQECGVAAEHKLVSECERLRWFARTTWQADATWQYHLLHFDRLGAFLDHPFYPTARAKLGFDAKALAAYGPEFQRSFELRWLAIPKQLHYPSTEDLSDWPELWPEMEHVGLPAALADTHALVPVHPFVWTHHLDGFLHKHGLDQHIMHAPKAYLSVLPTLSVRTVLLEHAPEWHLKLPLTIRTLGAKNIRTIKPSTIHDGNTVQTLLGELVQKEPGLDGRVLLTDEARGAHVQQQPFLGYILRRYPEADLQHAVSIPIAALLAQTPEGGLVAELLAGHFYKGDLSAFLDDYFDLTLQLHLRLWIRYGIALESNQQNSVLVLSKQTPPMRLLLKDNDAARIHADFLRVKHAGLAARLERLQDRRILVDTELPLAQMFTTITLQLNIAVLVEDLAPRMGVGPHTLYAKVRRLIEHILTTLEQEGEHVDFARKVLLESEYLPIKYLLIAATLAEKANTGATDVNKFYGQSAPNFLRSPA
jgi:siderophore synthetase component